MSHPPTSELSFIPVLQGKVLPDKSCFESSLEPNPSFVWHGIWETRRWLEKGSIWGNGDGKSVTIWKDPWLLDFGLLLQEPSSMVEAQPMRVHYLIDSHTNC